MDPKRWQLPVRRVPVPKQVVEGTVWNNVRLGYEQSLFGQLFSLTYSYKGTLLGGCSSNQTVVLHLPYNGSSMVNQQSERKSFSLRFRDDDRMTVQSVEQRVVVRSTETAFERQFQGHTRDVRDAIFLSKTMLASCSDDTTVRVWDMVGQNELCIGKGHSDYVRSLALFSEGCFFSGSYDHTVNLWDTRTSLSAPLQTCRPEQRPVETLLYVDSLHLLFCGSGDLITAYDMRSGFSAPLLQESHHTKVVTALAFSPLHGALFSGSLDHRVKIFSVNADASLQPISAKKFKSPVSALAVHPTGSEFAVGMTDGMLQVLKVEGSAGREGDQDVAAAEAMRALHDVPASPQQRGPEEVLATKTQVVRQLLVSFRYQKALKTAMYSRHPDVILSTLDELLRRGALHVALSGHNDRGIVQILRFAADNLEVPALTDSMMTVIDTIFEIYGSVASRSPFFYRELTITQKKIGALLASLQRMEQTIGMMEAISGRSY